MPRIFAFGETVYDIIFKNAQPIAAKAGGSMLNTSVSLGKLGLDVNFVSDLGNDLIGDTILDFLIQSGVSTKYIERYENQKTAIAIAFLDERNDASYTFYKDFPDNRLTSLKFDFEEDDIVLFGSFFALTENIRPVLLKFLNQAREKGCIIIYDPNFRKPHLHELEKLKPFILENIALSDIIRGSDEDFSLIFGAGNSYEAFKVLVDNGCGNLVYTANSSNVIMMSQYHTLSSSVPVIEPVSTIGAGDNFNAGLIWTLAKNEVSKKDMNHLPLHIMEKILANGISFSAEVCMSFDNYISEEFASRFK
ncbi:MAG: PfkB family carbohydrate kinase [Bacteroidales bacterium]|nr:PfkB family carbohydrate kinase [Bacteroidales bacterium]